jgi:hypothetical protein
MSFITTYDSFIDNYAVELKKAISDFKKLNTAKITEEDLEKAYDKVNGIYDRGVAEHFEGFLTDNNGLTIVALANIAFDNSNRYGTEMRQILNALEDYVSELSDYLPEEDED